jgi:DNA (cytosine-5)-methyltransferase 1
MRTLSVIRLLDLFSGIGGFSLAAERVGMRTVAFCEIDRFARRVLAKHWPGVPCFDDVRELTAESLRERGVRGVDCITFGFPCQDLSVAGKRAGLAGGRSGLFWEAIRLARSLRPHWLVAENVPGLRSSNGGRDMAAVVGAFAELGYVGAWRSLDAQYFGLAQRRERVFFVAGLGARGLAAIQLVLEGGGRYPAPRREAGARSAGDAPIGALQCGADERRGWRLGADEAAAGQLVARGDTARYGKGTDSDATDTLIPFDTTQITSAGNYSRPRAGDPCHPLAAGAHAPAIAHTLRGFGFEASEDGSGRGTPIVAFNWQAGGNTGPTLDANSETAGALQAHQTKAVAFTERTREAGRTLETQEELAYALTNPGSGGRTHSRQVLAGCAVRRLTPTECELLQGAPVGHTCLCGRNEGRSVAPEGAEPCKCADGSRYRALGNSVAVPVVTWLMGCIAAVQESTECDSQ